MNVFQKIINLFKIKKTTIYTNDGHPSSNEELDRIRGMHIGREAENMKFSLELKKERLNKPTYEYFVRGHKPGSPPKVIPITAEWTGDKIKEKLKSKGGGMYYTGRVKTYEWVYKKRPQFLCLAEMIYYDDDRRQFVPVWQGPNPNSGYHGTDKWEFIEGAEPLIIV